MRNAMSRLAGSMLVAGLGLVSPGMAQDSFVVPEFYSGARQPSSVTTNTCLSGSPLMVNMIWMDAFYANPTTPAQAALQGAAQVMGDIEAGRLPPGGGGRVCLYLWGFGHNTEYIVDGNGQVHDYTQSPTRFYRELDRLPGLLDDDFPVRPPNDGGTARAYKHPFLINSGTRPTISNVPPPMRVWMTDFCHAWKDLRASNPAYANLPDPDRFFLDSEPALCEPPGPNSIWMLHFLATHGEIWNQWPVPGAPAQSSGQPATLASLYAQARSHHPNWPADITDSEHGGIRAGILYPAIDGQNRPFFEWYWNITAAAEDAVMEYSAYSVIRSEFPSAKAGNFGHSRFDGLSDTTGWYRDRVADGESSAARRDWNRYPRGWVDRQVGQFMYRDAPGLSADDQHQLRWTAQRQWCSGHMDNMYLFFVSLPQWEPTPGWQPEPSSPGAEGHKQLSIYRPTHAPDSTHPNAYRPPETYQESNDRLNRGPMEADINSFDGGNENRPWPWLEFVDTETNPFTPTEEQPNDPTPWLRYQVQQSDFRALLAMLRGKNFPGGGFWSNWAPSTAGSHPTADNLAWNDTTEVIDAVYASRVDSWKRRTGRVPDDPIDDQDDADPLRLEFTLRVNGLDRTVDISTNQTAATPVTELFVQLSGLGCYKTHAVGRLDYEYQINVECSTDRHGTAGRVLAYDFAHSKWVEVPVEEGRYYGCYAPIDPDTGQYSNRRTFFLRDTVVGGYLREFVSNDGLFCLRLVHLNTGAFTSKYDLVQVIPYRTGSGLTGSTPLVALQTDVDFDEMVTTADLAQYMAKWLSGNSAADINLDGQVDALDLLVFLNTFAEES